MPAMLDWLAATFVAGSRGQGPGTGDTAGPTPGPWPLAPGPWSLKALHRLIVTSAAYRRDSRPDARNQKIDPDNQFLWRANSRRLDAELVRDNVLHTAGQLDATMGGPDIDQNLGLTVKRRSIYFRHAAEKEMEFLQIFDGPNVTECYFRKPTVVPQQALALANSELALTQARLLARALSERRAAGGGAEERRAGAEEGGGRSDRPESPVPPVSDAAFVQAAFERVLSRAPSAAEVTECLEFLADQARKAPASSAAAVPVNAGDAAKPAPPAADGAKPAADPALRAREHLVLVLFNHSDFVTVR
jgi:hypothetical protein